ncbi:hypothetical protein AB0K40_42230 [Nonomuraea bangladeshensis]|uniref:DUF4149 domain-containing protein n=1 Tax=Nonomuraea bangladeshensis TaxID=404385 RepID=A0ABV3HJ68_9ACTN
MTTHALVAPASVKTASALWFIAVGAGVFEAALAVSGMIAAGTASFASLAGGLGLRLTIFAAAIFLAVRLSQGHNWARVSLALSLGVFGTLSLVIEPIQWLLAGNSVVEFFGDADLMTLLFTFSRVIHLAAVLGAMSMMFGPAANPFFRRLRPAAAQ